MEEINFGGIEREPQASDFHLGSFTPDQMIPETFMPEYPITVEMQKKIPDCGANAGVYLKELLHGGDRLSVEFLWNAIKQIDNVPPENGTTLDCIMKALNKTGACNFALLPTNSDQTLADFTNPAKLTSERLIDAQNRRIGAYAFQFNPTFFDLKKAIYTHKAVIILVRVGAELWTPNWKDCLPLDPNKAPITSGHFMVATGYDKDFIYGYNEWSEAWGNNGMFKFGENYMPRVVEIGTAVDLMNTFKFTQHLSIGMTNTDVGVLQKMLKSLGLFPATQSVTSFFGSITLQAVKDFQTKNGIPATGFVGDLTLQALNNLLK